MVTTPAKTTVKAVAPNLKAPNSSLSVATELARFIKENKLVSSIQGKEYVNVEGWQFAGSRLGIIPIMGEVEDLSTDTELRYRARVSLYDLHNKIEVGGGVAECSNKERTKKFYEAYAICSMSQTRAVGKAYRNILAWLIKAAGFEATPYEEMLDVVEVGTSAEVVPETKARPTPPAAPAPLLPAFATPTVPAAVDENGEVMAKAQVLDLLAGAESHAQLETLWIEEVKGVWGLDVDVLAAAKSARARLNSELQATA